MEKYYQPKIEDLHVGYEYYFIKDHTKEINEDNLIHIILDESKMKMIFTSVRINLMSFLNKSLDKDDFISQGWELNYNHDNLYVFTKGTYDARWWSDNYIEIYDSYQVEEKTEWSIIYEGSCPSINEFKQISKLLNIQ